MNFKKFICAGLTGALTASLLVGCGIDKDATVATLGDTKVSLGLANFMCRLNQASYDDLYTAYVGEKWWDNDLYNNGTTMIDSIKSSVMEALHQYYTLEAHMSDYDVELSDDQKSAITEAATAFMDANSSASLKEIGATQEIVEEYLTLITEADLMQEAIIADADTNVSDEEANMRGYTLVTVPIDSYTDDSGNTVTYTEDEVTVRTTYANAICKLGAEEDADLSTIAETYGFSAEYATYDSDDSSLDENLKTALDGLKEGDAPVLVSTDTTLYVVRLDAETDEEATESNRESIISDRQDTLYSDTLAAWQEDDGWDVDESALAKIKFDDAFTTTEESTEDSESVDTTES